MQKNQWRIIYSTPSRGAWNMALDEAILEAVAGGSVLPTLRLYAWEPPCLSLGQAQPVSDVDLSSLAAYGWDLVRRPTGGRAILHTDELTYSVIARQDEPQVSGSILESYRKLSVALIAALEKLDLPAQADKQYSLEDTSQPNGAVCFEVPSNYEITVHGKKIIGSAQARRLGAILQHGSLPLCGDLTRITHGLAFSDSRARELAATRLLAHAATVETFIAKVLTWEQASAAFQAAFEQAFEIEFAAAQPSTRELKRAAELVDEKYGNSRWTYRV